MASPIVTNTSAQLNGASLVYGFSVTLTDAQIKALPVTPVTIIAAPGSGYRIKPVGATFHLDASAGAYTNINTTYASLQLQAETSAQWLSVAVSNDSTLGLTRVTTFLGQAFDQVLDVPIPFLLAIDHGAASGSGDYIQTLDTLPLASQLNNKALQIAGDNNGSGAWTGGNAANGMKVTVYYAVEAL